MRSTLALAVLLLAMAVVLLLAGRQTRRDVDAVRSVTLSAKEDVTAQAFDAVEARRLATRMRSLLGVPRLPLEELRQVASRAASWAAALSPGTPEYHTVVNLRGAADELLAASESLADPHRIHARRLLESSEAAPGGPVGGPPGAVGGIRDQLQNLQHSHQEKLQEAEQEQH